MADVLNILTLVLVIYMTVRCMPILIGGNGVRPFTFGYLVFGVLIAMGVGSVYGVPSLPYELRLLIAAATFVSTIEWAART